MKLTRLGACASLAALAAAAGGCGSGSTRTVSVSSSVPAATTPPASSAQKTTPPPTRTAPASSHPATPQPAPGAQSGGAPAPAAGSSHEPAFVQGSGAQGLGAAVALMRSRGYSVLDSGQYRSDQTLKVLVGSRQGPASHLQQAFFFVDGRYLGTDTSAPSAQIRVVGQNDTEVTLAYSLYRARDAACCPSGGEAQVRYQLDNGRLVALDPIPAVSASSASAGRQ